MHAVFSVKMNLCLVKILCFLFLGIRLEDWYLNSRLCSCVPHFMLVLLLILESFGSSEIKFESPQLPMGVSLANTVVCPNKRINHSCTDLLLQINVRRREEFHRDQNIVL